MPATGDNGEEEDWPGRRQASGARRRAEVNEASRRRQLECIRSPPMETTTTMGRGQGVKTTAPRRPSALIVGAQDQVQPRDFGYEMGLDLLDWRHVSREGRLQSDHNNRSSLTSGTKCSPEVARNAPTMNSTEPAKRTSQVNHRRLTTTTRSKCTSDANNEPTGSETRINGSQTQRSLPTYKPISVHVRSARRATISANSSNLIRATMWPSWRRLIILSFLMVLLTSLLASLDIKLPPASSCLLFNHCSALTVAPNKHVDQPHNKLTVHGQLASAGRPHAKLQLFSSAAPEVTTTPTTTTLSAPGAGQLTPATSQQQPRQSAGATQTNPDESSVRQQAPLAPVQAAQRQRKLSLHLKQQSAATESNATSYSSSAPLLQDAHFAAHHNSTGLGTSEIVELNNSNTTSQQQQVVGPGPTGYANDQSANNGHEQQLSAQLASEFTDNDTLHQSPTTISPNNANNFRPTTNANNNNKQIQSTAPGKTNTNELDDNNIVVGRRPSQQEPIRPDRPTMPNQRQQVPASQWLQPFSSTGAIKLIASPTLSAPSAKPSKAEQQNTSLPDGWTLEPSQTTPPPNWPINQQLNSSNSGVALSAGQQRLPNGPPPSRLVNNMMGANSLLESVVREALNDLVANAADEPVYAAPVLLGDRGRQEVVGSQPATLRQLPLIDLRHFRPATILPSDENDANKNQHQKTGAGQQPMMSTASASAPSVSLPPLSHLLVPRNPFRLFASSSAPIATRYFPALVHSKGSQQASQANSNKIGHQRLSIGRWLAGVPTQMHTQASRTTSTIRQNHQAAGSGTMGPLQGIASLPDLDVHSFDVPAGSALYAHSHSAEQLERLVRAASQAGHLHSPPILPAIVSAPSGHTFPGFYIPAIEPPVSGQQQVGGGAPPSQGAADNSQESQVNELRHGEHADLADASLTSKIPGTDYILHPEEVRAMMNIGEQAWRRQKQLASSASEHQQSGPGPSHQTSASTNINFNSEQTRADGWKFNLPGPMPQNLMQENHSENARDYAYVDLAAEHMQGAQSATDQQRLHNQTTNDLGGQLTRQLVRSKLNSFPAIIRVNDQDYVHWPLVRLSGPPSSAGMAGDERRFGGAGAPSGQHLVAPPADRWHAGHLQSSNSGLDMFDGNQNRPGQTSASSSLIASASTPSARSNGRKLENSSVRFATQLTPSEIRQVEDSILETLIMAQTMQHQQKVMQALAAANQPVYSVHPAQAGRWPGVHSSQWRQQTGAQKPESLDQNQQQSQRHGLRHGFFSRRRRRNSATANGNQKRWPQQRPGPALSSSHHFLSMLPMLDTAATLAPLTMIQPLATYADHELIHTDLAPNLTESVSTSKMSDKSQDNQLEPVVVESELSNRLPVVMADQETNKPNNLHRQTDAFDSAKFGSNLMLMNAEATNAKVTILSPRQSDGDQQHQKQQNQAIGEQKSVAESQPRTEISQVQPEVVFGSRVRSHEQPKVREEAVAAAVTRRRLRTETNGRQQVPTSRQVVAFVPIQDNRGKQVSLYNKNPDILVLREGETQSGAASRTRPNRINVDWPAMASDADYFPPQARGTSLIRWPEDVQSDYKPQQASLAPTKPIGSQLSAATTPTLVHRPSSRRGNFVTSQMKLQFAQDYQAREGVPIYNNNVRVAGALDRQRSLESAATVAARRPSLSSGIQLIGGPTTDGGGPADDNDYETDPGDLQKGGTNTSGRKAELTSDSKKEPAGKPSANSGINHKAPLAS